MWKRKSRQQPLPFTEDQIRAKAYEIWQQRGSQGGSAEEDWQQAIAELESATSQPNHLKPHLEAFGSKDDREFALKVKQFHWERLKTLISALGLAATIFAGVGLYLTYKSGQEQQQLAREQQQQNAERLITERFAKAVEQLGSPQLDVRIGAIYSLERIAKDSPKDHWTIMEVLTAFVRNRSPLKKTSENKKLQIAAVTSDVQSALTVIGRRNAKNDLQNGFLDLMNTNLVAANLNNANLEEVDLYNVNLERADLSEANLQKTYFHSANLQGAILSQSNLHKASLSSTNLEGADLSSANLQGANLSNANLQGAILLATDFRHTPLTQQQLKGTNPPLLCNVALPKDIKVNPDRDCDRTPQELVKLPLNLNLEDAKQVVNKARQRKWE